MKRYKKETLRALINREAHFYKKYIEANQATMEYTDNILENKRGDYGKKRRRNENSKINS